MLDAGDEKEEGRGRERGEVCFQGLSSVVVLYSSYFLSGRGTIALLVVAKCLS